MWKELMQVSDLYLACIESMTIWRLLGYDFSGGEGW